MSQVGGDWNDTGTRIKYVVEKNKMMITLPLQSVTGLSKPLQFEFKWSDNMQAPDPLDWYVNGDAAPEAGSITSTEINLRTCLEQSALSDQLFIVSQSFSAFSKEQTGA